MSKKLVSIILSCSVFLLIISTSSLIQSNQFASQTDDYSVSDELVSIQSTSNIKETESFASKDAPTTEWTFMTYLDGDNNLEEAAISDLQEMELGGGTNGAINVITLIDRNPGYDMSNGNWVTGRYYEMSADSSLDIDSVLLQELGEVEMDNPDTLQDFIEYCFVNYPADKYCLNIWDHGGGIFGVCWDDTTGSGECLTINEIQTAIKGATTAYAETIDVLSFDCCVMGMIEIAYEIRNYCDYLVFSEESIPFDGYNYEPIIAGLHANPTIDSFNFSKLIVDEYANEYDTVESTCLSVIDLSKILATIPYVRNFAGNLTQAIGEYEYDFMANMARGRTRSFYDLLFIDIIDFANRLNYFVDLEMVNLAANELIPVIEETIAYNWQHDSFNGTAHGLSIFLPVSDYGLPEGAMYHYANKTSYFTSLDWSSSSYWGEFIRFYYDHYQLLQPPDPQMLSLGTQSSSQTLDENHHQEFIISIPENGIYEFNLLITSGDVDLKIAASFSEGIQYFGFSNLVNPDDNSDETCRLYLKKNIYYIFIKGIDPTSTYKVFVQEYSFPTLALNTPTTTGGGSPVGDGTGHFEQIINHYYTVDLLVDEYLFVLNNSVTTDYELVLYNSDWSVLAQSGSTTIGEDVLLYYNNTAEQIIFITIFCTTGAGNFTIEAIGAARSDLQGLSFLTVTILSLSIFSVIAIINVKKQKKS